jgi:pyruvate dehydrogenase E1 component
MRFRDRFEIPLSDAEVVNAPLYRPPAGTAEYEYMQDRRRALGGSMPQRRASAPPLPVPAEDFWAEFAEGTGEREVSTTMAIVRVITKLMRDPELGKYVVPIVPDEARTFGMEAMFRTFGIYSHPGQTYEPVDSGSLLYYKESRDGQMLEEGITEAGSMSSFIAAGTSYSTHGLPMMPFFIYYSMFGLQRVGDLIWAAADSRTRGFLVGGTSGRTTLAGEGLQHQDGHSHVLASTVPTLLSYDPAFAFELAVIVREGIRRMYANGEDVFYYLTVGNEPYAQPAMPEGVEEGIVRGMYRFREAPAGAEGRARANLLGSGAIMNEVLAAQAMLAERYGVAADAWSVTSYTELRREALDTERWNRLHPTQTPRVPYVTQCLGPSAEVFVAASDYMKAMPDSIARWLPGELISLGTDGFGRSEARAELREFFEVDARHIVYATLAALADQGAVDTELVQTAMRDLAINPDKPNPMRS